MGEGQESYSRTVMLTGQDKSDMEAGEVSIIDSMEASEVVALCRRLSMMHFEFILNLPGLVQTRMEPKLVDYYNNRNHKCRQRFWFLLFVVFVVALPTCYIHTMMENPCIAMHALIDPRGQGPADAEHAKLKEEDCDIQEQMTKFSIRLGLMLISATVLLTILMSLLTTILQCCHDKCGSKCINFLEFKRQLWRPLLLFWYLYVQPRAPSIKYMNEGNIIPGLYTPTSVMVCFLYMVVVAEMSYFGWLHGHLGVGLVIAYTMGEICLYTANYVMGASRDVVMVTDSHMENWRPTSGRKGRTVLRKLAILTDDRKHTASITMEDFEALKELDQKQRLNIASDRMHGENTLDGVGVFERVYLIDTMEIVDLVRETIQKLGRGEMFDSIERKLVHEL